MSSVAGLLVSSKQIYLKKGIEEHRVDILRHFLGKFEAY